MGTKKIVASVGEALRIIVMRSLWRSPTFKASAAGIQVMFALTGVLTQCLLLLWPPFFFVSPERLRLRRDRPSRTILIRKTIPSLIRNAIVLLEAFLQSYLSRAEAILVDRTSRYTSNQYR